MLICFEKMSASQIWNPGLIWNSGFSSSAFDLVSHYEALNFNLLFEIRIDQFNKKATKIKFSSLTQNVCSQILNFGLERSIDLLQFLFLIKHLFVKNKLTFFTKKWLWYRKSKSLYILKENVIKK